MSPVDLLPLVLGAVIGLSLGALGGGFLIVPALVLLLGFGLRDAVGTSLAVIALISAFALVAHLGYGALDPRITLLFVGGGVAGALAGAAVAGRLNEGRLQAAFALLVVLVGAGLVAANVVPALVG